MTKLARLFDSTRFERRALKTGKLGILYPCPRSSDCTLRFGSNLALSQVLFRISITNLWSAGSFFRKGVSTARKLVASGISSGRKTETERLPALSVYFA
jgi:hypothetical protein